MENTKIKSIKVLAEKIKKTEKDLEILREKKDTQIMKEMYAIINKRKIPIEYVFYILENYDFSSIEQDLVDDDSEVEEDEMKENVDTDTDYNKNYLKQEVLG